MATGDANSDDRGAEFHWNPSVEALAADVLAQKEIDPAVHLAFYHVLKIQRKMEAAWTIELLPVRLKLWLK